MVNVDQKVEYKAGIKIETEHIVENSLDKMKAATKQLAKRWAISIGLKFEHIVQSAKKV